MQRAGEVRPSEPPVPIEAVAARKPTVPSREDFVALIAEAARLGTITHAGHERFDELYYYLGDINVYGKRFSAAAGLRVTDHETTDAPTTMSVKAVSGGYDVTFIKPITIGNWPFEKTRDVTVRLGPDDGQVTIGRERQVPASAGAAKVLPMLPIAGAIGAIRAIFTLLLGRR